MATKKRRFVIEQKPKTEMVTKTIRVSTEEDAMLKALKERHEARSENDLIRHAIRFLYEED